MLCIFGVIYSNSSKHIFYLHYFVINVSQRQKTNLDREHSLHLCQKSGIHNSYVMYELLSEMSWRQVS